MKPTVQFLAVGLLVGLAGCTSQRPAPDYPAPLPQTPAPAPSTQTPTPRPPMPTIPSTPKPPTTMKAHPRYAPPPGGNCHWDTGLGVYVLEKVPDVYYRERTYYRWDGGWFWSNGPQGPWQETDSSGVPPGLSRRYAQ
ncbi:hypothetical protein JQX08_02245 [Pseudomonas sp. UL073]|uniref:Lipoprotein n=1 Tax=Zestomonas insulae TaxID=2809017 RepID=A0ABS2IA33_9GAMM|nr:hypothetical protein [Pseudomonas insulae]MBM7059518.1 hypothetical protein [Pseudomonas insulae]